MACKIVVTLDGSELSEAILPHAETLLGEAGSEVFLLRVVPRIDHPYMEDGRMVRTLDEEVALVRQTTLEYLESFCWKLEAKGFKATPQVAFGDAAESIVEFAQEVGADVIAMSTHGRTGIAGVIFGSVARKVMLHGGKPVLVFRPAELPKESVLQQGAAGHPGSM